MDKINQKIEEAICIGPMNTMAERVKMITATVLFLDGLSPIEVHTMMDQYRTEMKSIIANPLSKLNEEQMTKGLAFMRAWDEWAARVDVERKFRGNALVFLLVLPWYLWYSRGTDKVFLKLNQAQEAWNDCMRVRRSQTFRN